MFDGTKFSISLNARRKNVRKLYLSLRENFAIFGILNISISWKPYRHVRVGGGDCGEGGEEEEVAKFIMRKLEQETWEIARNTGHHKGDLFL